MTPWRYETSTKRDIKHHRVTQKDYKETIKKVKCLPGEGQDVTDAKRQKDAHRDRETDYKDTQITTMRHRMTTEGRETTTKTHEATTKRHKTTEET